MGNLDNGGPSQTIMAQNDILRVAARLNVPVVGDFVNVFHYRQTDIGLPSEATVLADFAEIMEALYSTVVAGISAEAEFVDINVFNITQDRPMGSIAWPTLTAGGAAGDMLPAQAAAFVRATTGFSRNWAKKFIGPCSEGSSTPQGFVAAALVALLEAFAAEWITTATPTPTNTYESVVYHRSADTWRVLTSGIVTNVWATIRRRRVGVGA